jgi:hypothetical protein
MTPLAVPAAPHDPVRSRRYVPLRSRGILSPLAEHCAEYANAWRSDRYVIGTVCHRLSRTT